MAVTRNTYLSMLSGEERLGKRVEMAALKTPVMYAVSPASINFHFWSVTHVCSITSREPMESA
jgi:hypothetical protein